MAVHKIIKEMHENENDLVQRDNAGYSKDAVETKKPLKMRRGEKRGSRAAVGIERL
jgi:hypothetical protein